MLASSGRPGRLYAGVGWEKGQVENQVGLVRERFFTPRLRFKTYDELNAWLLDKCIAYAKTHAHPERPDTTVWAAFEEERPHLVPYRGRFDGFHALPASVSKTLSGPVRQQQVLGQRQRRRATGRDPCLCRPDRDPAGRPIVAEHARCYGVARRSTTLALRAGAGAQTRRVAQRGAVQDWVLPAALERVRRKLSGSDDGDRQMVSILAAVLTDGLPAVEAACAEALAEGVHSADVIINILARRRDPPPIGPIATPASLTLRHAPIADCARYDQLRRA